MLPPRLRLALQRAQAAERVATGAARIPAFRLTRALIGGARLGGYPRSDVAACLEVSEESLRARGGSDGWITPEEFADLTDLPLAEVRRWLDDGVVSTTLDELQRTCCPASELVRALAREP